MNLNTLRSGGDWAPESLSDNMIGCPLLVKVLKLETHPSFRSVGFTPLLLMETKHVLFEHVFVRLHLPSSEFHHKLSGEKKNGKTYEIQNPGCGCILGKHTMHKCHPELGAGNMKSVFFWNKI